MFNSGSIICNRFLGSKCAFPVNITVSVWVSCYYLPSIHKNNKIICVREVLNIFRWFSSYEIITLRVGCWSSSFGWGPHCYSLDISLIIIIISRHQHRNTWPSPATPPYRPLLPTWPQCYILYRHRAAVCRFELVVLPLLVHLRESTRVHHLWSRPYFSSSVLHVWFG